MNSTRYPLRPGETTAMPILAQHRKSRSATGFTSAILHAAPCMFHHLIWNLTNSTSRDCAELSKPWISNKYLMHGSRGNCSTATFQKCKRTQPYALLTTHASGAISREYRRFAIAQLPGAKVEWPGRIAPTPWGSACEIHSPMVD